MFGKKEDHPPQVISKLCQQTINRAPSQDVPASKLLPNNQKQQICQV
jgi:hypothetical protein